jgi:hypothetical protein
MKRTSVAIVLLALTLSIAALGQQAPPMILVYDETVRPDSIAAYEKASKEFFQILTEQIPEAKWSAVMTDDFHYVYVIPIPSMAAIDGMHKEMEKMVMAVGPEKFGQIMEASGKTTDHTDALVLIRRDDLSYRPATMLKPEETNVIEYNFYYLKPGSEFAAEQIAKDYAALMKKQGIEGSFTTYQLLVGAEMPALVIVVPAKSALDLAERNAKTEAKLGKEVDALDARALAVTRRFDRKIGRVRPDLADGAFRKPKP